MVKERLNRLYRKFQKRRTPIYLLSDKKVKGAKNLPLFKVKYLNCSQDFSGFDALVFTSKNAIYALDAQSQNYKNIPSYVIAPQTAKALESLGGNLAFVGKEGHGNAFAHELLEKLHNKKALYIRGESVVSNLVGILNAGGVECDERVVYKTECVILKELQSVPKGSTIIFSSPSTIECFFKNREWDASFVAIAIGKTTASYFPKHITPIIAASTSLDACVEKARELQKQI